MIKFGIGVIPSAISRRIMAVYNDGGNPIEEYIKWVKKMEDARETTEEIYDYEEWDLDTDYYKVIGTRSSTYHSEHIESLREFVKKYKDLGFDIVVDMM